MGYGRSEEHEHTYRSTESLYSEDEATRRRAETERVDRLNRSREAANTEEERRRARPMPKAAEAIDRSLARLKIEEPPANANRLYVLMIDNSSSNELIARAMCANIDRLQGYLSGFAQDASIAIQCVSDHCDHADMIQEVDWLPLTGDGKKVFLAGVSHVRGASGGDLPEAYECGLHIAATKYRFGNVPRERRHLILVGDDVAHGMGGGGDRGCPDERDWRTSLEEVQAAYGTFQVIACGTDARTLKLQEQFIRTQGRLRYDLVDLSTSERLDDTERRRLVIPATIFLMARCIGTRVAERYLTSLFEDWLAQNHYGKATETRAREQIGWFADYLEVSATERQALLRRIFGTT